MGLLIGAAGVYGALPLDEAVLVVDVAAESAEAVLSAFVSVALSNRLSSPLRRNIRSLPYGVLIFQEGMRCSMNIACEVIRIVFIMPQESALNVDKN